MIRENDTPGSPNLYLAMTPGHGLYATVRSAQDAPSRSLWEVGPASSPEPNLLLRLQRAGREIAGFYSRDGKVWVQAGFSPQQLPTLKEEALFGLAVTSHARGRLTTGRLDQVSVEPGAVLPYGIQACGGDRAVLLQWRPLPGAVGYNLYRGPAGAAASQLQKRNDVPVAGTSLTDTGEGLANDTVVVYGIAAVFKAGDGEAVEGPLVTVTATPIATPPGWMGCSIGEQRRFGSATFDAATGEITIGGSGGGFWFGGDQVYFLNQRVEGDVEITVKALVKPTGPNEWAKAGLMIRDSLEGTARSAYLMTTPANGLAFQYRTALDGNADWPGSSAIKAAGLSMPLLLRLTRKGQTITPEYSTDDGKTFQPAGEPLVFGQELPQSLYVGLAVTSTDISVVSRARFRDLVIRKR
jgi:regulation of enolase protein 1 (concanavalin A-like superfamily)